MQSIHLRGHAKESSIAAIDGDLVLSLPVGIDTITLDSSTIGKPKQVAGATVTLKRLTGQLVTIDYQGESSKFLKMTGYNAKGEQIADMGSPGNCNGDNEWITSSFVEDVHSVKVHVAHGFVERKFPFVLKCQEGGTKNANSASKAAGEAASGNDFITTANYANKQLEFFYFIPSGLLREKNGKIPVIVAIPGLSGRGEGFVSQEMRDFAVKEHFMIIAPSFVWDQANWNSNTSYQYPEAWSGNALIQIIDKVKEKHGISASQLHLFGFSAGAQYALRFANWRPDLCASCAAHGSGGTVIPTKTNKVKFLVSVGKEDAERIGKAEQFYSAAKGLGIDVVYKQYEGGHGLPSTQVKETLDFIARANKLGNGTAR